MLILIFDQDSIGLIVDLIFLNSYFLIYSLYRGRFYTVKVICATLIVFTASDSLTYRVFKQHFKRSRPEFVLEKVQLRTHSHTGYSFPSNHAANSFAAFVFLGFWVSGLWQTLFLLWACLVAYSRIYVGVHFPADILSAALLGTTIAFTFKFIFKKTLRSSLVQNSNHESSP